MYKDKEKQREATRERVRRYREAHQAEGVTPTPTSKGVTAKIGVTYPGIIDILTDRKQRTGLEKIVQAFKESHHPEYAADVYVGVYGPTVLEAGDLLECTQDVPLPA
jgi:hypothetical protein